MTSELRHELGKFEDSELIQRIAEEWLTEEATHIAIEILEERGCKNILFKIEEAKERSIVASKFQARKRSSVKKFFTFQFFMVLPIFLAFYWRAYFHLNQPPTNYGVLIFILERLLFLPTSIAILRGKNIKTASVLFFGVVFSLLLAGVSPFIFNTNDFVGGLIFVVGWLIAIIYSIKK